MTSLDRQREAGKALNAEIAEKIFGEVEAHAPCDDGLTRTATVQCSTLAGCDAEIRSLYPISALSGKLWPAEYVGPNYSEDISAAFLVVEKMTTEAEGWERWSFSLYFYGDTKEWTARFSFMMLDEREREYPLYEGSAEASTAPLAICRAALLAIAHSKPAPPTPEDAP